MHDALAIAIELCLCFCWSDMKLQDVSQQDNTIQAPALVVPAAALHHPGG